MADYRKMWEDLGMDVENHDLLCSVLPGAIGDVFLSQENRPEAMDYFDMVLADVHGLRPAELVEFKKNGGKVFGTFCTYVPDEIIFAGNGIATGLCAGSQILGSRWREIFASKIHVRSSRLCSELDLTEHVLSIDSQTSI